MRPAWIAFGCTILLFHIYVYVSRLLPQHDTLETLTYFHFFYSNFNGEPPAWMPFINWGVPLVSELYRTSLSQFLVAIVGWTIARGGCTPAVRN